MRSDFSCCWVVRLSHETTSARTFGYLQLISGTPHVLTHCIVVPRGSLISEVDCSEFQNHLLPDRETTIRRVYALPTEILEHMPLGAS